MVGGRPRDGHPGRGGYAERAAVPAGQLLAVPPGFSWLEAGAIPEVFLTAADALVECGRLRPGEHALVHTAGGGVGTAALQLARALGAASVIGTASAAKLDRIRDAGLPLDLGVDRHQGSFADAVAHHTGRAGADVILDTVGAPYWEANLASLATLGRLVIVGVLGGMRVQADLRQLMGKRATVVGTVLRAPLEGGEGGADADVRQALPPGLHRPGGRSVAAAAGHRPRLRPRRGRRGAPLR